MLATPAEPGLLSELDLHHRCTVGEYAIVVGSSRARNTLCQPLQPALQHFVIIASQRITRHIRFAWIVDYLPAVGGTLGLVIDARGDHTQRPGDQLGRARTFEPVLGHIIHTAMEARA